MHTRGWMRRRGGFGTRVSAQAAALLLSLLAAFTPLSAVRAQQGTLTALQTDVDQIARRARPSVVAVIAQRTTRARPTTAGESDHRVRTRVGSGVAIDEQQILTTASVVLGAEHLASSRRPTCCRSTSRMIAIRAKT